MCPQAPHVLIDTVSLVGFKRKKKVPEAMTPGNILKHKRIVRLCKTQTGGRDSDRDATTHFVQLIIQFEIKKIQKDGRRIPLYRNIQNTCAAILFWKLHSRQWGGGGRATVRSSHSYNHKCCSAANHVPLPSDKQSELNTGVVRTWRW